MTAVLSKTKTNRRAFTKASSGVLLGSLLPEIVLAENVEGVDICVYGATASGIAAAIGAVGCGRECVVSRWRLGRAVSHLA